MKYAKIIGSLLVAGLVAVVLLNASVAQSEDYTKTSSTPKAAMPTQYLIELPHTQADCLKALDDTKAMGADKLNQWSWGCKFGDHTGYTIVNAKSETEALSFVPAAERGQAKIFPLTKFTVEQIESFHAMTK